MGTSEEVEKNDYNPILCCQAGFGSGDKKIPLQIQGDSSDMIFDFVLNQAGASTLTSCLMRSS
jgi:hypothetical protein